MDKEKLFEMLGIESGAEFEYFDNMADLLECDEYIDTDVLYALIEEADVKVFKGLFETYFDDVLASVPDEEAELHGLISMMKAAFMGMCNNGGNAETYDMLSVEINKFREWFVFKESVIRGDKKLLSVRDALTNCRYNNLSGDTEVYDFEGAMEYDIDEYAISLEDLEEYEDEE